MNARAKRPQPSHVHHDTLKAWLEKIESRRLVDVWSLNDDVSFEVWILGSSLCVIRVARNGWEIYTAPADLPVAKPAPATDDDVAF